MVKLSEASIQPVWARVAAAKPEARPADWRAGLPFLTGKLVTLRELRKSDAPALAAALSNELVTRFVSPPPQTIEGYEKFIAWAERRREAGDCICLAVVPHGSQVPVGLFQIRAIESSFATAEWGFALAAEYWGTGVFSDGARLAVDFAFDVLGAHRLEARAAIRNGRGNGALRKLGAVQEAVLRQSFLHKGEYLDQALWAITRDERFESGHVCGLQVVLH